MRLFIEPLKQKQKSQIKVSGKIKHTSNRNSELSLQFLKHLKVKNTFTTVCAGANYGEVGGGRGPIFTYK